MPVYRYEHPTDDKKRDKKKETVRGKHEHPHLKRVNDILQRTSPTYL